MEIESTGLGFRSWKSSLLDSVFVHGNRALWTRFNNTETRTCQRCRDEQWRRKKQCKTQQPRCRFALILTKPRRRKLMRWKSDRTWFLVAAPVEERSNDAKTQQPRRRFWPNLGDKSFRRWKSDWTCGFSPSLQWRRRTRWRVGLICFGFDLFMGFWGLEVESGTTFGEKKERKNKKKNPCKFEWCFAELKSSPLGSISMKEKWVLWAWFSTYVDSLSTSAADAMRNLVQYTRFIHQNWL